MVRRTKVTISRAHSLTLTPWKNLTLKERIREVVLYADQQKGHAVTLNFSDQFAEYGRPRFYTIDPKRLDALLSK